VQNKVKISISQNLNFIFSYWSQLLSLLGSKKNEPTITIYDPFSCLQGVNPKDLFGFEKAKINRQYFRATTLSVDEANYISHYQYSINKKFSLYH
jgi:hypothetical protein